MGDVELVEVDEDDKPVLANLLQFYRYDLSEVRGYEVTEHGVYVYRFLDHYFIESDRDAFVVRHDGALAGFAMSRSLPSGEREVAEFFVMRGHRRAGVGARAAGLLFATHPGRWVVAFDEANAAGAAFWPGVVQQAAVGDVEREQAGPPDHVYVQAVLRFSNT